MAAGKSSKLWIIILSIPIVLFLGAAIAAKLYFTSGRLRAMVLPEIEQATHRTVSLDEISLSFFPPVGVAIKGLTIANPATGSFETPAFLTLQNLRITVNLWALLTNKVEVSELRLDKPTIFLEVSKDGKKNFKFGADERTEQPVTSSRGGNTSQLLFSNIRIEQGTMESVNRKFDTRMVLEGVQLSAQLNSLAGNQLIRITGSCDIGKFSYGSLSAFYLRDQPVHADLGLTYRMAEDVLSFEKVTASVKDLPLTVSGSISSLRQTTMMMDLSIGMPKAEMTQLLSLVPAELLKAAKGLSSTGDVQFTMTVRGPLSETINPGISATFSIANGTIRYASLPKSITAIAVRGGFEMPPAPLEKKDIGSFTLDEFSAMLGSDRISGGMKMANFDDPLLNASFNGSVNLANVHEYYALEPGTELAGLLSANIRIDGPVKKPESIKAGGTLTFQDVVVKSAGSLKPLRNLSGSISFNNQLIESKRLAMTVGESDLTMAFTMKNYLGLIMKDAGKGAGKPSATITLQANQLRTADFIAERTAERTETKSSSATTGKPQPGLLPDVDIDASMNVNKLVTEKFTFTNVRGTVGASDGTLNLRNVSLNAFDGSISARGKLDLKDQRQKPFNLNLDIRNVASDALLSPFSQIGKNLFGKLTMSTAVQGDLNDTLGLNLQTLLGNGIVHIADGKVLGLPVTQKLSDFTGVSELREVNFKDWANAFSIENGRVNIRDLKVNAGPTAFAVNGSQGLDGSLDYSLNVRLPESVSDRIKLPGVGEQLLQYFKDKDGRYNLMFAVSGNNTNPSLKLDTRPQEEMAKQAIEQKKQKLLDEGKNKLEEGLKKLLKRP